MVDGRGVSIRSAVVAAATVRRDEPIPSPSAHRVPGAAGACLDVEDVGEVGADWIVAAETYCRAVGHDSTSSRKASARRRRRTSGAGSTAPLASRSRCTMRASNGEGGGAGDGAQGSAVHVRRQAREVAKVVVHEPVHAAVHVAAASLMAKVRPSTSTQLGGGRPTGTRRRVSRGEGSAMCIACRSPGGAPRTVAFAVNVVATGRRRVMPRSMLSHCPSRPGGPTVHAVGRRSIFVVPCPGRRSCLWTPPGTSARVAVARTGPASVPGSGAERRFRCGSLRSPRCTRTYRRAPTGAPSA